MAIIPEEATPQAEQGLNARSVTLKAKQPRRKGTVMEAGPKKVYKSFHYQTSVRWIEGRRGAVCAAARPDITVSSPPEFKGQPGLWTPEELYVAALNSCLLMTFLAYAQREELEVAEFDCAAEALLEYSEGKYRITEVILKPKLTAHSEDDALLAREVLDRAHDDCIISNSVRTTVKMVPQIHWDPGTTGE
jgi:organic hydroperoxide reductase OsmC/OhrA